MTFDINEFQPDSIRYRKAARKRTRRARSLALAQILIHLSRKTEYAEFAETLDSAARRVRKIGHLDAIRRKQAVLDALQAFASELQEICEETLLSEAEARKTLESLISAKIVTVRFRNNFLVAGEPSVPLYFLTKDIESIPEDLELFPHSERRNAKRK